MLRWTRRARRALLAPVRPIVRHWPPPFGPNRRQFLAHPLLREGLFSAAFRLTASATTMTALLVALGASPYAIGALGAVIYGTRLLVLGLPGLFATYGEFPIMWLAAGIERVGWALVLGVVLLHPANELGWALGAFGVAMAGTALYDSGILHLQGAVIAPASRAGFAARRLQMTALVGCAVLVLAGFVADLLTGPGWAATTAPIALIAIGLALSGAQLGQLRQVAARAPQSAVAEPDAATTPPNAQAATPRSPRALIVYAIAWNLALGLTAQHTHAFALQVMGVSIGALSVIVGLILCGQLIGAMLWGRLADQVGAHGVLAISTAGLALDGLLMAAAWWVHPAFLAISYLSYGIWACANTVALWTLLLDPLVPRAERIRTMMLFQAAAGVAMGVGPMVGAFILDHSMRWGRMTEPQAYLTLFLGSVVARLWARHLAEVLPGADTALSARAVWARIYRLARWQWRQHARRIMDRMSPSW